MKRNLLIIIVGAVLVVIFALLLFTFQVRQSEVAVVTTFGRITGPPCQPGLHLKWPWPIQQVYRFDERIQDFQDKFSENLTADSINLITSVYVGWRISDPPAFLNSFKDGSVTAAQGQLQSMLTSAKSAVVGKHPLSDFVNADPKQLKFDAIQNEIEQAVQDELLTNSYGIRIEFLGIKKLGLPAQRHRGGVHPHEVGAQHTHQPGAERGRGRGHKNQGQRRPSGQRNPGRRPGRSHAD